MTFFKALYSALLTPKQVVTTETHSNTTVRNIETQHTMNTDARSWKEKKNSEAFVILRKYYPHAPQTSIERFCDASRVNASTAELPGSVSINIGNAVKRLNAFRADLTKAQQLYSL